MAWSGSVFLKDEKDRMSVKQALRCYLYFTKFYQLLQANIFKFWHTLDGSIIALYALLVSCMVLSWCP